MKASTDYLELSRGQPKNYRTGLGKLSSFPEKKHRIRKPIGKRTVGKKPVTQYQVKKAIQNRGYGDQKFKRDLGRNRSIKLTRPQSKLDLLRVFLIITVTLILVSGTSIIIIVIKNENVELPSLIKDVYSILFLAVIVPFLVLISEIIKRKNKK